MIKKLGSRVIKIVILAIIMAFFINLEVKAADEEEKVVETAYYYINYEEDMISEIEPKTDIGVFKSKLYNKNSPDASEEELTEFRNNIKVYQDRTCRLEVTKGYVGTGMAIRYNDEIYELSVVGDLNGDGQATQIEVTALIKYIIGLPSTVTDGVYLKSADFTLDGNVNQIDITKFIRYIVFGEFDLGKIDSSAFNFIVSSKDETTITLKFNIDEEQIEEVKVFIKKQGEEDTEYIEKLISEDTCELTELDTGVTYTIKVTAKNKKGRVFEKIIDVKTEKIPDGTDEGAIIFGEIIWENKKAKIEISTETEYQIEYQVNGTDGEWIKVDKGNNSVIVSDLSQNDVIYARLTDEYVSGNYAEKIIKDEVPPKIELTLLSNTQTTITVEATITDDELGVSTNPTYIFYIKKAEESEENFVEVKRATGTLYTYLDLEPNTNYTIKMATKDAAGNLGEEEIEVKTKKIIDLIDNGEYLNAWFKYENANGKSGWTNEGVIATLETKVEGYTIQTKIDDGEWEDSDNQKLKSNSEKIYARLIDGDDYGEEISGSVTNIDIEPPEITDVTATSRKITIIAEDEEEGSGIVGYQVTRNTVIPSDFEPQMNKKTLNIEIDGFEQKKEYYVWVKDEAGNISECKKVKTETVPNAVISSNIEGNIVGWTDRKAAITLSTNTNYSIEYQINSIEGQWTNSNKTETTIDGLNQGDTIYVHLTDGLNAGQDALIEVIDGIAPEVSLNITHQNGTQVKVEVIAEDNESGIKNYTFSIKEKGQEIELERVEQESNVYTFENLEEGKTYEIKVIVKDNGDNEKEETKEVTIEPPPNLSKEGPNANVRFIYTNVNGAEGWTNDAVDVRVETTVEGYLLRTSKDGINWSNSNTQRLESNDEKIYAVLTDGASYGLPVMESPTNIDKNKPVIKNAELDGNRINIKAEDTESGITEYAITTGPKTPVKFNKCEENNEIDIITKTEYKQSGTYYVWTKDKAGNVSDSKSVTINNVPNGSEKGAIVFGEIKWKDNKATVSVSTEMEYQIQYQINSTEDEWINIEEEMIKLDNLNHNDVIYARLTDGINVGNYATLIIEDRIIPQITKTSLQPTYIKERVDIHAVVDAIDAESGIDKESYAFYIKKMFDDDSTYVEGAKWDYTKAIFENMEIDQTYVIKIIARDIAGNEVQVTREITTKKH